MKITEELIYDRICLPVAPYEFIYKKVKHPRLCIIAAKLSKEFKRSFEKLDTNYLRWIMNLAKGKELDFVGHYYSIHRNFPPTIQREEVRHISFFELLKETEERATLDAMVVLLEDNFIMKDADTIKIWISNCFHDLTFSSISDTAPGLRKHSTTIFQVSSPVVS
jgi:hypothetical protein